MILRNYVTLRYGVMTSDGYTQIKRIVVHTSITIIIIIYFEGKNTNAVVQTRAWTDIEYNKESEDDEDNDDEYRMEAVENMRPMKAVVKITRSY